MGARQIHLVDVTSSRPAGRRSSPADRAGALVAVLLTGATFVCGPVLTPTWTGYVAVYALVAALVVNWTVWVRRMRRPGGRTRTAATGVLAFATAWAVYAGPQLLGATTPWIPLLIGGVSAALVVGFLAWATSPVTPSA